MARHRADRPTYPMRRRLAAVALGAVSVVGLGLASASQVTLGSGSLGVGTAMVASCQGAAPIAVSFTTTWTTTPTPAAYRATQVTLSGVAAACGGSAYKIRILDGSGNAVTGLGDLTGTVPAGGGVVTSTTFTATPVAGIGSVAVVIQS